MYYKLANINAQSSVEVHSNLISKVDSQTVSHKLALSANRTPFTMIKHIPKN